VTVFQKKGDIRKVTELELRVFKRTAVAWHLVDIGRLKGAGGIQIRECNVRTILKWVIKGKDVTVLISCGSGGEGLL
jgi:hypothetical protein